MREEGNALRAGLKRGGHQGLLVVAFDWTERLGLSLGMEEHFESTGTSDRGVEGGDTWTLGAPFPVEDQLLVGLLEKSVETKLC